MSYRRRYLNELQSAIPLDMLRAGMLMRRDRASSVHATGDRVLAHGRRILASIGLHGAGGWHVSDTSILGHPSPTTERVVLRVPALALTPGHFLRVCLVSNPAGRTEVSGVDKGAKGKVKITATFDNGTDTVAVERVLGMVPSTEAYAAQPQGDSAAWTQLRRQFSTQIAPCNVHLNAELADWSDGVTVALAVAYIGAPRVVDLIVYEEPYGVVVDLAAGEWPLPMHSAPAGGNLGQLPGAVPVIKRSASDPGAGAEIICAAARRQAQEVGPVLVAWSAWDEGNQSYTATETTAQSVTSTTDWIELVAETTTSYDAATAGWSLSSAANARRVQEAEEHVVLRDDDVAVPVRCWVYARTDDPGGTATIRFETALYSLAEATVTGDTWGWTSCTGVLRSGLGAQDPTTFQVRGKSNGVGVTLEWRYIVIAFDPL